MTPRDRRPADGRISKSNSHSRGTMLSAVPPGISAGMDRGIGRRETRIERAEVALRARDVPQFGDDFAGGLDGVDAEMGERGMTLVAVDMAAHTCLPLCAITGCIAVGSPMMHRRGFDRPVGQPLDQAAHADAADLLVIGERQMDRRRALGARNSGTSDSSIAMKLFMSAVPRPKRLPSRSVTWKGRRPRPGRRREPRRYGPTA